MPEIKKAPKRSETAVEDTWALEDLFATNEAWFEEYAALKSIIPEVEIYRGKLAADPVSLEKYFALSDDIMLRFIKLANYAFRRSDEDTANAYYQDMKGKVTSLEVEFASASSFDIPEITSIGDSELDGFYAEVPSLEKYRRHLYRIRRRREHILSAPEEKILASAGEMAESPDNISTIFQSADLKFPDVTGPDGAKYPLTQGSYIPLMENSDREIRRSAFENLYNTYGSYKNTVAALLDAQTKQLMFFSRARKYDNTLSASLDSTEVPVSVYENLIGAVNGGMDAMYRYVKLRKKLMGVDELHMYDLYAPIVADYNEDIPYDTAVATILEGLKPLGEDYLSMLREGFENRWVDKYENEGKVSGAYSAGCTPHPYVLLNYKNTLDSQFTLAHEMGHSLHSYLSLKNQPTVYSQYVIFVAEVASTCNEVLLMLDLLGKTTDKRKKAYLINYFLEQFRTTLYRQTMFAEFELEFNRKAEAGETLTADLLCDIYYKLNQKYYGDGMTIDPEIALEWARIPHFFYNYYVFQYSTGFSAAVAIAEKILREGKPAVDAYLKFLSSGGSDDPISLLKLAGIDMTTAGPVNDAIKLFDSLIDEMDGLIG